MAAAERLRLNNEDLKGKIDELSAILAEKIEALKQKKQQPAKKEKKSENYSIFVPQLTDRRLINQMIL